MRETYRKIWNKCKLASVWRDDIRGKDWEQLSESDKQTLEFIFCLSNNFIHIENYKNIGYLK